jgi:hypothetical protein
MRGSKRLTCVSGVLLPFYLVDSSGNAATAYLLQRISTRGGEWVSCRRISADFRDFRISSHFVSVTEMALWKAQTVDRRSLGSILLSAIRLGVDTETAHLLRRFLGYAVLVIP